MYRLTIDAGTIVRVNEDSTETYIPTDATNSDYQAYLAWLQQGNVSAPYVAPPPLVPYEITRAQGLLALYDRGLLALVPGIFAAIEDEAQRTRLQLEFDNRLTWQRDNETLLFLADRLGLDAAALDELFIYASTL